MGQLGALLYKDTALLMRQRKSLLFQGIVILVLLFATGITNLVLPGLYQYNTNISTNYYSGASDFEDSFCTPPVEFPDECLGGGWWGLNTGPADGDSPGVLTNSSYLTGVQSGMLGQIKQYSFENYQRSQTNYWSYNGFYAITPEFHEAESEDDIDQYFSNAIIDQRTDDVDIYNGLVVPNVGLIFNSLSYKDGIIDFTLQTMDAAYESMYYLSYYFGSNYYYDDGAPRHYYMATVASAFMTESTGRNITLAPQSVTMANRYVNYEASYRPLYAFLLITPTLMLLLPLFVLPVVMERSNRTLELNKLMGMKMWKYWLSYLIFDYTVYLFELLVVIIFLAIFLVDAFWDCGSISVPLWLLWGSAQVTMGLFIGAIFKGERTATLVSYLMMFLSIVVAYPLNIFLFAYNAAPWWYIWFPPWTYIRGFYLIENSLVNGPAMTLLTIPNEMILVLALLPVQAVIMFFAAYYLEQVMPKDWGNRRPFYFPIMSLIHLVKKPTRSVYIPDDSELDIEEGEDCAAERQRAKDTENSKYVMNCINIRKEFGHKVALHAMSLAIESEETFGLLGPNGAGKTTLLSILSGMLRPTAGTAFINGYDIITQADLVQDSIGICPQFDILWDDLTVNEHLRFYMRMKKLKKGQTLHIMVNEMAEAVGLQEQLNKTAKSLSGGMQRKLSIAIALCGDPKLVLLDEPSSGLDPEARREIWDIINEAREGRSFVITTHNMEEADILCSRIAIVTRGKLACIGNQQFLKNKFGKGYSLSVTCKPGISEHMVHQHLSELLPDLQLDQTYPGQLSYLIENQNFNIGHVFSVMRENKEPLGIQDYSLSQTSLEEVFLKILEMDESTEAMEDAGAGEV